MGRYEMLREWMRDNHVTLVWTASRLGITDMGVLRLIRSDRISVKRHAEFVALGFPPELLPKAEDYIRKPIVPVWEQDSKATA